MKKLMIAAAIVCAAALSQAATTQWKMYQGTSGVLYDGYKQADGGTYSAAALQTTVFCVAADLHSQEDLVAAFRGDSFTLTDYTTETEGKSTNGNGKLTSANGLTFSRKDAIINDYYKYFEVVLYTYKGTDYLYVSDNSDDAKALDNEGISSFTVDPTDSSQKYWGTAGYSGAGWYTAVPEPTSGLLLLLGVAGLALRRRRA